MSEVTQSCPTLCDPVDCNLPGFSVHGILQARILEWEIPFPSQGYLPEPGIEPGSPTMEADALTSEPIPLQGIFPRLTHLIVITLTDHCTAETQHCKSTIQ